MATQQATLANHIRSPEAPPTHCEAQMAHSDKNSENDSEADRNETKIQEIDSDEVDRPHSDEDIN